MTFLEACQRGEASAEDIDDWIERWHTIDSQGMTLAAYLGMTEEEYSEWLHDSQAIHRFIAVRKGEL